MGGMFEFLTNAVAGLFGGSLVVAAGWFGKEAIGRFLDSRLDVFRHALRKDEDRNRILATSAAGFMERQLSEFYWPLYIRLQKDAVIWRHILKRSSENELDRRLAEGVDSDVMKNHEEVLKIIQDRIYLSGMDGELEEKLLAMVHHLTVYRAIRGAGVRDVDPYHLGVPWPGELFEIIKARTERLQKEYEDLLAQAGLTKSKSI